MASFGSAKVVEYLEPLMSKELLCKFPDNSAFDFDYSQSSIWSPLVTRAYTNTHSNLDLDLDFLTPKKLDYETGCEGLSIIEKKKKTKRKIGITNASTGFALNLSALKIKKRANKKSKKHLVSDLSPSSNSFKGACNPLTKKVNFASLPFQILLGK